MRLGVLTAGLTLALSTGLAQNLVPNGDYESYTSCPTSFSQTPLAAPWFNPTGGSSDYFNACATPASAVDVPNNQTWFGWQMANSGVGYGGGVCYGVGYREYHETPLTTPLTAGTTYEVSMYVSLGNQHIYGIEDVGMYLSVGPVTSAGFGPLICCTPQVVHTGGIISDTLNWTLVSGTFVASGGEDHLTIGGFEPDATCNWANVNAAGVWPYAYYYYEDVCVALPGQCVVVLPVELKSFEAKAEDSGIKINWTTASETNSAYFNLERSADGKSFHLLQKIDAMGTTNMEQEYSFMDTEPIPGAVNYYRLQQVDKDHKAVYSEVIAIEPEEMNKPAISVYPVPAYDEVNLDIFSKGDANLRIFNSFGALVHEARVTGSTKLQLRSLPAGNYIAVLNNGGLPVSKMFLLSGNSK